MKNEEITDTSIVEIIGIPPATLARWKTSIDWRRTLYLNLKGMNANHLKRLVKEKEKK